MEFRIGRLSEEFGGALPSRIFAEMQRLPVGFLDQVVEYRVAAAAYYANKANLDGLQDSPMRTLMKDIEHEQVALELESKG